MIRAVGIDSVEIHRFQLWHTYAPKKLSRVFHETEIHYCLSCVEKSAERFAARFAAKEAFFKALHSAQPSLRIPLFTICKSAWILKEENGAPYLHVEWNTLIPFHIAPMERPLISITHSQLTATTIVILLRDTHVF